LLELRTNILGEFIGILVVMVKVFLKVMIAKLIAVFVSAILVAVDLYGIISEVYKGVGSVFYMVLITTGPDIAFIVPVPFDRSILHEGISTNRTSSI
jgi:hypothetical protein